MIPEIEQTDFETIAAFQNTELQKALQYINANSPFYKAMFEKHSININSIQKTTDLQKLPFTNKEDLQLQNDAFLCVPRNQVIDYVTLSLIHI